MSRRGIGARGGRRPFASRRVAAPAPPFSPSDVAGLEAWYRETYAAGTWADLSGNGRNLTQATAGSRPTQTTRAGQAVLSFDGGDRVQGAFGAALPQPLTVYAVVEFADLAGNYYLFDGDDIGARLALSIATVGPTWSVNGGSVVSGGTPTASAILAVCAVYNGANSALYVNNFVTASFTGNAGSHAPDGFTFGSRYDGAGAFKGFGWEAIPYSGAHDAATRKLIGDYFTARYTGLTVTT